MFDGAQQSVGVGHGVGIVGIDVARGLEHAQGLERVATAQLVVDMTMHELQELHGELDIADAAGTALQLPVGEAPLRHLGLGAFLHLPDRTEGIGVEGSGPEAVLRMFEPERTQRCVAGHGLGLDQRLELPRVGPAVPVALV